MEISANPFAALTLISAPAVLTNASCVLLFGTGNRYGRAIDRVHQLSALIETAILGAMMLVRETRFSFRILKEESKFLTDRARQRVQQNSEFLTGK